MSAPTPFDLVVVAAGASRRMDGIDKLVAPLGGLPLLGRTISSLGATPGLRRTVVVTSPDRVTGLRAASWLPPVDIVIGGGARRQESVAAGIAALDDLTGGPDGPPDVVLIHDGARPLATPGLAARVADATAAYGAVIPVLPIAETVKRVTDGLIAGTIDRTELATAQTPQGFRREVLRAAYARFDPRGAVEWTDEAALCESCTIPVHVVPGESSNLKVTVPADLVRAEASLSTADRSRVGLGRDSHPFGPGGPLVLGGVEIPGAPRLHGHSDGDVALHAIADGLLGAAALGDLGRLFPADARTPTGIASTGMLASVLDSIADAGWRPAGIDLTILGARPRLAGYLDAMRASIAATTDVPVGAVSVKAGTGNLSGDEGAGRALSALAIVTLVRATDPLSGTKR